MKHLLTLTDSDHDRLNRTRNLVGLYTGYLIIVMLAVSALMSVAALMVKWVGWVWG